METSYCSKKEEVENFLQTLKEILTDKGFDIDKDFDVLFRKKNENREDPYITSNTLAALNYDKKDIKSELLNLRLSDYVETLVDVKDTSGPRLFVYHFILQDSKIQNIHIKEGV